MLILVAILSVAGARRDGRISPFVVGFEVAGWTAVFVFLTLYSVCRWPLLAVIVPVAGLGRGPIGRGSWTQEAG